MIARVFLLAIAAFATWAGVGLKDTVRAPMAPSGAAIELLIQAVIPPFPEAEGYGAKALSSASPKDCRGLPLNIIIVTNLGTKVVTVGSIRWALSQTSDGTYDIIIFRTGGTVNSEGGGIESFRDCVYVAGQSAPGGGFQSVCDTIFGGGNPPRPYPDNFGTYFCGVHKIQGASDHLWRYIKLRPNATDSSPLQGAAFRIISGQHIMIDHLSICCSDDKNIAGNIREGIDPVNDQISFQDVISYVPLPGSTGNNMGGNPTSSPDSASDHTSFIRNLMGGNKWRWPRFTAYLNAQVVNNVIFGWTSDGPRIAAEWGEDLGSGCPFPECRRLNIDWVNNYHKPYHFNSDRFGAFEWDDGNPGVNGSQQGFPNWYAVGNIHTGLGGSNPLIDQTQWRCNPVRNSQCFNGTGQNTLAEDSAFKASTVLNPPPTFGIADLLTAQETFDAITAVGGTVGASQRISCDGTTWIYNRDAVDSAFVAEARDSVALKGDWLATYGPFGRAIVLDPGTACLDTDGDGMPDAFEDMCTGSLTALAVDGDISGDGYFNIEEWLNGSNGAGRTLNWTDNASNEDGFRVKRDKGAGLVVIATLAPNVQTYFDPDARPDDDYQVVAFNATGESAPTMTVKATCR